MDENDTLATAGTVTDSAAPADMRSTRDALADILDDPETDTEETEAHADDEDDADPSGEAEDTSAEDSAETAEAGKEGSSADGRFVEHNARVKLPDGTTTTVSELAKGYFRQSDYTRKSQENAELRKAVDSERERVGQTHQQLQTQLDRMSAMLEQWKPKPPQDRDDLAGWIQYQQQAEAYQQWQNQLDTEAKAVRDQQEAERAQETRGRIAREHGMLIEKFPAMADPAKRATFLNEAVTFMGKYGFAKEDIGAIGDHRLILAIRDLMRADRLRTKAPQVAAQVKEKPKMVKGGKRGSDPTGDARRARIDRLRETGSRSDARRALMDLDL